MYHPVHVIIENVNDCRKEMHNNAWYFRKGYRKMVKSPEPVDILEKDTIETMILNGYVPMAVGGSGIRVINNQNEYKGYDGAIDKDLSSSLLVSSIGASKFIIIIKHFSIFYFVYFSIFISVI